MPIVRLHCSSPARAPRHSSAPTGAQESMTMSRQVTSGRIAFAAWAPRRQRLDRVGEPRSSGCCLGWQPRRVRRGELGDTTTDDLSFGQGDEESERPDQGSGSASASSAAACTSASPSMRTSWTSASFEPKRRYSVQTPTSARAAISAALTSRPCSATASRAAGDQSQPLPSGIRALVCRLLGHTSSIGPTEDHAPKGNPCIRADHSRPVASLGM